MELDKTLLDIISEESGIPIEELTSDKEIFEDLDMDSLDLMNVIANVEDKTGLKVEMYDFVECRTVKDYSDRLKELQAESVPQS
jgi:acyl carrier protein